MNSELVMRLEQRGDGAHVHTINKAIYYLQSYYRNGKDASKLEQLVREALATDKWDSLRQHMARWW